MDQEQQQLSDDNKDEVSLRDQTLPTEDIDRGYLSNMIITDWQRHADARAPFMSRREEFTAQWRDLRGQPRQGPWDDSSNFHVPVTLIYGKGIHARLWQMFSDPDFFDVKANTKTFEDKEDLIKNTMRYVLDEYANFGAGTRDLWDETLWDNVFDGSGYIKLYWGRERHTYSEVIPVLEVQDSVVLDGQTPTGSPITKASLHEKEVVKTKIREAPQMRRVLLEDVLLPTGHGDPQSAPWASNRIYMSDYDLKLRAQENKFDREAVDECIAHRTQRFALNDLNDEIKDIRDTIDGYDDTQAVEPQHVIIEWYGKAYIQKNVDIEKVKNEIDDLPEEVVVWVHFATRKVLGWTYLYRISPDGIRPLFKMDFIKFPDRSTGVGVGELLYDIADSVDSQYNLRNDAGILSALPIGVYRAGASLKPDQINYKPGTFYPVDDVNDLRVVQFQTNPNFGYQEEDRLNSYAERLTAQSDIQLGRTPQKVGVFRTATGGQALEGAAGIQLEIHYDRIARMLKKLFKALFVLVRERMPEQLVYRVTGKNGEPIFGQVSREDLAGNYDFDINVDVLSAGRQAQQQQAIMMNQTLINPAYTQTGVVTPSNIYELARNLLKAFRVKRIEDFLTPPPQYTGPNISPQERLHMIVVGAFKDPPVEDTVKLGENHEQALKIYDAFIHSDHVGLLVTDEQKAALHRLIQRHEQMLQAAQAGGNPNMPGMQIPREGFEAMPANIGGGGSTLSTNQGEPNGPVV